MEQYSHSIRMHWSRTTWQFFNAWNLVAREHLGQPQRVAARCRPCCSPTAAFPSPTDLSWAVDRSTAAQLASAFSGLGHEAFRAHPQLLQKPGAGAWLQALPSAALGRHVDSVLFRVMVRLPPSSPFWRCALPFFVRGCVISTETTFGPALVVATRGESFSMQQTLALTLQRANSREVLWRAGDVTSSTARWTKPHCLFLLPFDSRSESRCRAMLGLMSRLFASLAYVQALQPVAGLFFLLAGVWSVTVTPARVSLFLGLPRCFFQQALYVRL